MRYKQSIKDSYNDRLIKIFKQIYLPRIINLYRPLHVLLFGSRITGDWMHYSDLDVIVVSHHFKLKNWLDRLTAFIKSIDLKHNIQFFCYTPEEFERKKREIGVVKEALTYAYRII